MMADSGKKTGVTYITVINGPKTDKGKVGLWDVDPAHPYTEEFPDGGEAFIASDIPRLVALTPAVETALREGRIKEVSSAEVEKAGTMPSAVAPNNPEEPVTNGNASSPASQESTGEPLPEDLGQP